MVSIPYELKAQSALYRQNVALTMIKFAHQQDQVMVNMLDQAARSAPLSKSRGMNINYKA